MLKKDKLSIKNFLINQKIIIVILVRLNSKRLPQKAKLKIDKYGLDDINYNTSYLKNMMEGIKSYREIFRL